MATTATEADDNAITHGYRAVWRWHFFAALWIAPFLIILTITGALYLFDREFEGWWNRDVQTVAVGSQVLPLARQEAAVLAAFSGATVNRVVLPRESAAASIWSITDGGEARDVYLDPYSGKVTGTTDPDWQPMNIIRDLHGTLLGGEIGSHAVELVACWTLVMMATGIWLWWPRKWKAKGVFVPRLGTSGRRYWRDLHSIPSIFNALFVILLVLTGLPWSAFWGPQFARLGDVVPFVAASPNFKAPPKADGGMAGDDHAMHQQQTSDSKLPWTIQHSPAPRGQGMGKAGIADMEALLPRLDQSRWGGGVRIIYPRKLGDVFTISYVPDKAEGQRTIYVDPGSAHIIGNIGWADYSSTAKAVEWGVMTHMGRQYGLSNQLANLLVCLILIGAVIAGLILWWKRRPEGKLGAPLLEKGDRTPTGVKILLVALAALFPLLGVTMLPMVLWRQFNSVPPQQL
ncbi:PepSY domain-containing protein [Novosphingobium sp.]|uniref:PepSY-associated TM helix domain-containing protein n=1 Tax=Novosphingobium sp. TaxID=1874826 RepID=UPI0025E5A7C3|nr:PepSY domain-containing protein [Novosphingobium sp.]MCC6925532.1 PepSY domain-containing protein [Novosphingobium sp.]